VRMKGNGVRERKSPPASRQPPRRPRDAVTAAALRGVVCDVAAGYVEHPMGVAVACVGGAFAFSGCARPLHYRPDSGRLLTCLGLLGRLSTPSVCLSKFSLYGVSVWVRRRLRAHFGVFGPGQYWSRASARSPGVWWQTTRAAGPTSFGSRASSPPRRRRR
jgi:hypothetical protein